MTQEVKHTPGPWELVENSWAITTIYAPDRQGMICELTIGEDDATEGTQEEAEAKQAANARLIVAAPNLLAAIEQISGQLHNIEGVVDIDSLKRLAVGARDIARAAKAKAA